MLRLIRRCLLEGVLEVFLQLFIVGGGHLRHPVQVGDYFALTMDVFHIAFPLSFHFVDVTLQLIDQSLNLLLQDLLLLELLLEQALALDELLALHAHF